MPSVNISLPDRAPGHPTEKTTIDMDQAVLDNHASGNEATDQVQSSPSRVSKTESIQITSKASSRKGKEYSTEDPQEKEKKAISETPEDKKKRRQERKEKKEQKEKKNKSGEERAFSETTKEEKATAPRRSIAGNGMPDVPPSPSGSITRNGRRGQPRRRTTVCSQVSVSKCKELYAVNYSTPSDINVGTDKNSTEKMHGKLLAELNLLRHNAKTLSCELKTANETIRQLGDRNARMSELQVKLDKTVEQLESTTEENKEYSSRIRALEQAFILQESELDNALTVIRQNHLAKRELKERYWNTPIARKQVDEKCSIRKEVIASEEVNDQLSIRRQFNTSQSELEQMKQEHDMDVDKATAIATELAELKVETDVSRDQLADSHALIEKMKALIRQQESSRDQLTGSHALLEQLRALIRQGTPSSTKRSKKDAPSRIVISRVA